MRHDYPPEYDMLGCAVCRQSIDDCECPECPECTEQGNPECYSNHDMDLRPLLARLEPYFAWSRIGAIGDPEHSLGIYTREGWWVHDASREDPNNCVSWELLPKFLVNLATQRSGKELRDLVIKPYGDIEYLARELRIDEDL